MRSLAHATLGKLGHRTRTLRAVSLLTAAWWVAAPQVLAAPGPGLGDIDCTQDEAFRPLAFLENTQGGPTGSNVVILTGGYLMLNYANDSGGPPGILTFFDVSNPRQPRSVRRIDNADTRQFREAHSFPVAIIGEKHYVAIQTIRGIQFWDVTDVATASKVGNIDLAGVNAGDYENVAWQTSWQGRYLYVSGGNLGVFVIDAADPAQPKLLRTVPTGTTGGFRVGPLYAVGDYLVYSNMDQNGALGVLDISRADSPALLTTKTGLPRMYSFFVSGDRIYGAGRDGDFTIHSWSDPTRITEVKIARIQQDSLYVAALDNFAFSGRQENFVKIDLTDERNPRVIGEGTLGRQHQDHGQVTPMGNLIFIGNDHGTGSAFFCHQAGRDVTAPTILKVYPADGATFQPTTSRISIAWSDYIDMRSVSTDTIAIRPAGGAPLSGIYSYAFNTLSFGPDQPLLPNTTYEIVIRSGGVKDAIGNAVASEHLVRFSTGADIVPGGGASGAGDGGTAGGGGSAVVASRGGSSASTGGNTGSGGSRGGTGSATSGGAATSGARASSGGRNGPGGSASFDARGGLGVVANSGGLGGVGGTARRGGSTSSGAVRNGGSGGVIVTAGGAVVTLGSGESESPNATSELSGCNCRAAFGGTRDGGVLAALAFLGLLGRRQRRNR